MITLTNRVGTYAMLASSLMLILGAGCGGNDGDINTDFASQQQSPTRTSSSGDSTSLPEIDFESLLFDRGNSGLEPVYFDFDSYDLRPDALAALSGNAKKIRDTRAVIIQIEGHCDERGTQEYNLALGERRALATREHLIKLGVSSDRLVTISYGEEDPANQGHNEAAWGQNRRCEFNRAM